MQKLGVKQYRWSEIALKIGQGRTGKQIRERWFNVLDPSVSRLPWSVGEDEKVLRSHTELGNRWSEMCYHIKGRLDNQIKNRWHSGLRPKVERYISVKYGKEHVNNVDSFGRFVCIVEDDVVELVRQWGVQAQYKEKLNNLASERDAYYATLAAKRRRDLKIAADELIKMAAEEALSREWQRRASQGGVGTAPAVGTSANPRAFTAELMCSSAATVEEKTDETVPFYVRAPQTQEPNPPPGFMRGAVCTVAASSSTSAGDMAPALPVATPVSAAAGVVVLSPEASRTAKNNRSRVVPEVFSATGLVNPREEATCVDVVEETSRVAPYVQAEMRGADGGGQFRVDTDMGPFLVALADRVVEVETS